ncbi:outer membrane protein transport protein [Azoarcus sp. DN11]|uniref:OmpP1/FadL family transporter n=1 Tax=Azoarcus sp. DN11 TaxID=356837 RepID=UPI000EAC9502|nr:outer membrane protein transport protein [Azoarcus sp. DN11]AYH41916.1 hypothetical protein CDA09_00705 [Azoarcus sp. DN11]
MNQLRLVLATPLALVLVSGEAAFAGNFGSDLNLTLTPATGGMAGAGYVRPQDPVASVFGNPATLTQGENSTRFTFGAALLDVSAHAGHDGTITGTPFDANSDARNYLLPTIAVHHRLSDQLVLGGGLQVVSGLGSDFRAATALAPQVELVVFGANAAAAYQVTPNLSVGTSVTVAFGLLEVGLLRNTALTHSFGVRGSVGATYNLGPVILGASYTSPLVLNFDRVTETAPGVFTDLRVEQPQDVVIGIATTPALHPDWVIEADLIWKNWASAETYKDLWRNQTIVALGTQHTSGAWKTRLGFSYSTDLQKKDVGSSIGNLSSLAVGGATVPISPPLVQFVQATLTQPYWRQQVSAGVGYALSRTVQLDAQIGYAFDGKRTIGTTRVDVKELQAGIGFTWNF